MHPCNHVQANETILTILRYIQERLAFVTLYHCTILCIITSMKRHYRMLAIPINHTLATSKQRKLGVWVR